MKKVISVILAVLMVVTMLPLSAFAEDDILSYLTYEIKYGEVTITDCDNSISGSFKIPDTIKGYPVTSIDEKAFKNCISLKNIKISDSVVHIGEEAFYYCISLENITIPDSVMYIGEDAFYRCSSLKKITIPDSVTYIDYGAFSYCNSLESITIPDSVTYIVGGTFECCSSLKNITIPDSVTRIGSAAFRFCSSLESITIPDGVTSIEHSAFYYCSSLESITIPDSVTSIGEDAFYKCSSLKSVYYAGTEEQWNKISGDGKQQLESNDKDFNFNSTGPGSSETDTPDENIPDENYKNMISEDIVFLGVGEHYLFSAYSDKGAVITNDVIWSKGGSDVVIIDKPGDVYSVKEGIVNIISSYWNTEKTECYGSDSCWVFVGEPNSIEYSSVYDTDYYFSGEGFYSNVAQISETVDIYLSLKNKLADEIDDFVQYEKYTDEFEQLKIGKFTVSATVSGNDLSFKKDSYQNTYTETFEGIPVEQIVDDLLMLYPYELTVTSEKKSYTVTVKIESEDFETIEDTITFSISDLLSKSANEHIEHLSKNLEYNVSLQNIYGNGMVTLKNDSEYLWSKYTSFDFENYYQVVVADLLINLLNVAQVEMPSFVPAVISEYLGVKKEVVSTINTLVYDNYGNVVDLSKNAVDELIGVSKYRGDGIYAEDVEFQLIQKTIGNVDNAEKINKAFEKADKTKQVFKFFNLGYDIAESIVDWCNRISIFNAYDDANKEFKAVFEKLYDTIPASETKMREALSDYINHANKGLGVTVETVESLGDLGVDIAVDALPVFFGKGFVELLSGTICEWIGMIPIKGGLSFSTTTAFSTVQAAFGGFATGITLGLCLSDLLCNNSGKSAEMSKIVAMAEYTPYIIQTAKYYQNKLYNDKNDSAVTLFEQAFALQKASQTYVVEHTIKANEIKRDSIIIKLFGQYDKYDDLISDLLSYKIQLENMTCHNSDNDTVVRKTKVIAVKCPVNVFVYDEDGNLVVNITNNIVEYCADGIEICISESEKYIAVPSDHDYDIKIIATDVGTMDYAIREYDESTQLNRKIEKTDISLEAGKEFLGRIAKDSDEKIPEEDYAISSGDEIYIPEDTQKTECEISGHSVVVVTGKSPTCTETGLTEGKKCSVCNEILVVQEEISATGHTPGEWKVTIEAQVGVEGKEQQKCTVCDEVLDEKIIPALPDVTSTPGDVNGDGEITASDARIALRISAGLETLESVNAVIDVVDINNDGEITASDARTILRKSAGLE